MSQLRSTPLAAAVIAAASGACLLLSACSGGSVSPAAKASSSSSSPAASSSALAGPGSSGSPDTSSTAPAVVSTAGLTGNFCTDFTRLGETLDKLPKPANQGNLAADQAYVRQALTEIEGTFNGLATEAPPNVAAAIHNITGLYQTEMGELSTFGSLAQIKQQQTKFTTSKAYTASITVLVKYIETKCS
jgi:hypothetical protein